MIRITPIFKTVDKRNPISGHFWSETKVLNGFQVIGGKFCTTRHKTIVNAMKEASNRVRITELIDEMKSEGLL